MSGGGVQGAVSWQFSLPVISGFSKVFPYWCLQVLGPQCGEHEVDLSGSHLGRHRGKNPVAESPSPFWGKGIDKRPRAICLCSLGLCPQPPRHPGRALVMQRDPGAPVPPCSDHSTTLMSAGELLPLPQHRPGAGLQALGDEHGEAGPPAAVQASAGSSKTMSWPWFGSFSACLAESAPQRVMNEEQRRRNGCRSEGGWQDDGSQCFWQLSLIETGGSGLQALPALFSKLGTVQQLHTNQPRQQQKLKRLPSARMLTNVCKGAAGWLTGPG